MTEGATTHSRHLLGLRKQHPAWRLLAARTGPPVIATLKALFDENLNGVDIDAARELLGEALQLAHEAGEIESDGDYLGFKDDLVGALDIPLDHIAYVAELVEVKPEQRAWRGAIERALGGQRLRLLDAGRDQGRHQGQPRFMSDGYTHKLNYARHPLREALKRYLAGHDLHCVADTAELERTAHALTVEGTISGSQGRLDKQDQRALNQGWMTGFDNRDRVRQLEPRKVMHQALTAVHRAQKVLRSAALKDDQGESHYRALIELIHLLRDAAEHKKTAAARALLDPRYRLQFFVKVIERDGQRVVEVRTGSQGSSRPSSTRSTPCSDRCWCANVSNGCHAARRRPSWPVQSPRRWHRAGPRAARCGPGRYRRGTWRRAQSGLDAGGMAGSAVAGLLGGPRHLGAEYVGHRTSPSARHQRVDDGSGDLR